VRLLSAAPSLIGRYRGRVGRHGPFWFEHRRTLARLANWFALTYVLNNLNRELGQADAYPFVLSPTAIEKLRFVDATVRRSVQSPAQAAQHRDTDHFSDFGLFGSLRIASVLAGFGGCVAAAPFGFSSSFARSVSATMLNTSSERPVTS
jgi:hypothetical protein